MSGRKAREVAWPIIRADLVDKTVSSDVEHRPGAGAFLIFWANDVPCGAEWLPPAETLPAPEALFARGAKFAKSASPEDEPADAGALALVIPTRGRPEALAACLESVAAQRAPPGEVIVVDNDPGGGARDVVASFGFARYVAEPVPGLDRARNAGVLAASKPLIGFCDDDVRLHPGWSARLAAAFADAEIDAVTGLVLPAELKTRAQRIFESGWGFGRGFSRRDFRRESGGTSDPAHAPWKIGAGASMGFRRSVFARLGLFDTRLDAGAAGCSGDSEMWHRILMSGGVCRYAPDVVAFHRHRPDMAALRRQIRAYMRGHVAALLVQYARWGDPADLARVLRILPAYYARRLMRGGHAEADSLLGAEIAGYLSGPVYYLAHQRDEAPPASALRPVPA